MNENIIILTNEESYEAWGSLVELCKVKGFSHNMEADVIEWLAEILER